MKPLREEQGACRRSARGAARAAATFAAGVTIGALAEYVLDPAAGKRRRRRARDRAWSLTRRSARRGVGGLMHVGARTMGTARGCVSRCARTPDLDDVELVHKVSTEIFRDPKLPKERLSINAENGTVFVRGEVESPTLIGDVMDAVRHVRGVRRVENLMHLPGTPAPRPAGGALLHAR